MRSKWLFLAVAVSALIGALWWVCFCVEFLRGWWAFPLGVTILYGLGAVMGVFFSIFLKKHIP